MDRRLAFTLLLQETMRALVTKICSEIWFLPKFTIGEDALSICAQPASLTSKPLCAWHVTPLCNTPQ